MEKSKVAKGGWGVLAKKKKKSMELPHTLSQTKKKKRWNAEKESKLLHALHQQKKEKGKKENTYTHF